MVTPECLFITVLVPKAVRIKLAPHPSVSGVYECGWPGLSACGPGRPGDAVLVEIDNAPPGWLPLADILIAPTHATQEAAMTTADTLATRYVGSAIIAVPVSDGSVVIRSSDDIVIIRDRPCCAREAAIRRYYQLLSP